MSAHDCRESREAESDLWEARYHSMYAEAESFNLQLERAWALGARQEQLYEKQVAALKEQLAAYRDVIGALNEGSRCRAGGSC